MSPNRDREYKKPKRVRLNHGHTIHSLTNQTSSNLDERGCSIQVLLLGSIGKEDTRVGAETLLLHTGLGLGGTMCRSNCVSCNYNAQPHSQHPDPCHLMSNFELDVGSNTSTYTAAADIPEPEGILP